MLAALFVAVLALAPKSAAPARASDVTEAKRLYRLGEEQMAANRASAAVGLFRQAIVALPDTESYDELRHDLSMRLGYGLLVAHHQTGDRRWLVEAAAMLQRYAEHHTQLFGDDPDAQAERAEIYEQLYEVESRLAPPADGDAEAATPSDSSSASPSSTAPASANDDVIHRKVRVKRRRGFTSIDDPEVRADLESPKTDPESGLWGTMPDLQPITPARAYVRIAGAARPSIGRRRAADRRTRQALAQAALASVRPALRDCFAQAFTRNPIDVVRTEVE
ncbi:MAG TPA: hypothetical protein VFG69_01985, partial [Nannocystaceae bacterium]|nr:hypothetical protein [Nannocystaceae bacterium]